MRGKGKKSRKSTIWEVRSSRGAKKGQGTMSLAGCRDSVPAGVWGNAPTVPRPTNPKEAANKGAGSEAPLPVTLRFRRSAPKLLYPQLAYCRAKWARPSSWSYNQSCSFAQAGVSRLWARPKGNENRRSLRSPFGNLRVATTGVDFCRGRRKSRLRACESCHHCLAMGRNPHADGCKNHPNCDPKMKNPRKRVIMLARE